MPDEPIAEVPRVQWQPLRPSLASLCGEQTGILTAYRTYGYRLRQIADHLGVHPATVSRTLARLEQTTGRRHDPKLGSARAADGSEAT